MIVIVWPLLTIMHIIKPTPLKKEQVEKLKIDLTAKFEIQISVVVAWDRASKPNKLISNTQQNSLSMPQVQSMTGI